MAALSRGRRSGMRDRPGGDGAAPGHGDAQCSAVAESRTSQAGAYMRLAEPRQRKGIVRTNRPAAQAGSRLSSFYQAHRRDPEAQAESVRTMEVIRDHHASHALAPEQHVLTAAGPGAQNLQVDPETHEVIPGRDGDRRIFDPEAEKSIARSGGP